VVFLRDQEIAYYSSSYYLLYYSVDADVKDSYSSKKKFNRIRVGLRLCPLFYALLIEICYVKERVNLLFNLFI